MLRVVASWQKNYGPMTVLQWTARPTVVARPQVVGSPIAKNANPCKRYPSQRGKSAEDSPNEIVVETIFGRSREVRDSRRARDKYTREAKAPPHAPVQTTNSSSPRGTMPKPDNIFFTETEASWVHHPHEDTQVITAKIANSLIHRVLVDSGSIVNILYWNAYQKIRLKRANLHLTTLPLYEFTGESVIPEGTIKLAITLGEAP